MKKEVILAIVIGFGIGLLITFGIYTMRTALEKNAPSPSPTVTLPSPEPSAIQALTITEPQEDTLTETDTITIRGKTAPQATVTIVTEDSQNIAIADNDGNFSTQVELTGGANKIVVTSFAVDGTKEETSLTIVYSTAEF